MLAYLQPQDQGEEDVMLSRRDADEAGAETAGVLVLGERLADAGVDHLEIIRRDWAAVRLFQRAPGDGVVRRFHLRLSWRIWAVGQECAGRRQQEQRDEQS